MKYVLKIKRANRVFLAYFSQGEYNIISVDYSLLAPSFECYDQAVANVPIVGKCLAQLILAVIYEHGPFTYVHALGFGLGAQIMGIAGPLLIEKGEKFDRGTGKGCTYEKILYEMY